MNRLLALLKIHPGEGAKVARFALLAATLQAGLAIGMSCADSLFLSKVGPDKLPLIYMITPAIMLVYVPLFAWLMSRFGIDRLFDITLGVLSAGGVALYLALTSGFGIYDASAPPLAVFYIAKLYTALWYIALYTLLWNFVDCYFHILDAKRLFSFLSGGMAFGAMAGGGIVTVLVRVIGVRSLFLVWSALALAVFPVLMHLRRDYRKIAEEESLADEEKVSFREQARRILHVLQTSRYSTFMVLTFLCTLTITTLCEFQYMQIFETNRTDADIAMLFGRLYLSVNAFNLLVNIFFFNRLIALIGVRNTALIQPIVYAAAFSYLLLQSGFGAAVAAFFAYQGILTSVEYNNQNFLFNALPSREKAQVRTFIEGLCEPLATAAAGLFLAIYASRVSPQFISMIGLAGAAVALCSVFGLRAHYVTAMVENLKKAWLSFSHNAPRSISALDHDNLDVLRVLAGSANREHARSAIAVYWLNDRRTAVDLLLSYLEQTRGEDQRAANGLLTAMLEAQDSTIFRRLIDWLGTQKTDLDAALLETCGRHNLLSPEDVRALSEFGDMDKQTAAAVARWQSWRLEDALEMLRVTHRFCTGSEEEQVAALHIIGASNRPNYVHFIAQRLDHPSMAIRKEALKAIAELADPSSSRVVPDILRAMSNTDHETRLSGFEALRAISDPACVRPLIAMSAEFPPCDRRHVEDIVLNIGLPCVPILAAMLRDDACPHTHKIVAARALGMLSFPQFETLAPDLIRSAIDSAYQYLISRWTLRSSAQNISDSAGFLADLYRDAELSILDFVLELLTIAGQLPDFEMLASSLRSTNSKERADAIETIEQGCTRDVFRLLLPLVDSSPLDGKVTFYRRTYSALPPSIRDAILASVSRPLAMESAGAIQAAWRLCDGANPLFTRQEVRSIMKERILNPSGHVIENTIFALLTEAPQTQSRALQLSSIGMATLLSRTEFFKSMSILEMEQMLPGITTVEIKEGPVCRRGEACDSVYVVLDGSVHVRNGKETIIKQYALVGGEAIGGSREYTSDADAQHAVLLRIPVRNIMNVAELYPQVAIGLLAERLGVTRTRHNQE